MRFLGSGSTVGTESGSSALDRRGEIRRAILAALREQPGASFDEVASVLPEGWDEFCFFALSPPPPRGCGDRHAQILVQGEYSGVLSAGRHYLPVRSDLSDLAQALEQARDPHAVQELVDRTHDEVVMSGENTRRRFRRRRSGGATGPRLRTRRCRDSPGVLAAAASRRHRPRRPRRLACPGGLVGRR